MSFCITSPAGSSGLFSSSTEEDSLFSVRPGTQKKPVSRNDEVTPVSFLGCCFSPPSQGVRLEVTPVSFQGCCFSPPSRGVRLEVTPVSFQGCCFSPPSQGVRLEVTPVSFPGYRFSSPSQGVRLEVTPIPFPGRCFSPPVRPGNYMYMYVSFVIASLLVAEGCTQAKDFFFRPH